MRISKQCCCVATMDSGAGTNACTEHRLSSMVIFTNMSPELRDLLPAPPLPVDVQPVGTHARGTLGGRSEKRPPPPKKLDVSVHCTPDLVGIWAARTSVATAEDNKQKRKRKKAGLKTLGSSFSKCN